MNEKSDLFRAVVLIVGAGLIMSGHVVIGVALVVFAVFIDD